MSQKNSQFGGEYSHCRHFGRLCQLSVSLVLLCKLKLGSNMPLLWSHQGHDQMLGVYDTAGCVCALKHWRLLTPGWGANSRCFNCIFLAVPLTAMEWGSCSSPEWDYNSWANRKHAIWGQRSAVCVLQSWHMLTHSQDWLNTCRVTQYWWLALGKLMLMSTTCFTKRRMAQMPPLWNVWQFSQHQLSHRNILFTWNYEGVCKPSF